MSSLKKCDRCGTIMNSYMENCELRMAYKKDSNDILLSNVYENFDLCPKCREEILEVLRCNKSVR